VLLDRTLGFRCASTRKARDDSNRVNRLVVASTTMWKFSRHSCDVTGSIHYREETVRPGVNS
jgi:hypothetical protein